MAAVLVRRGRGQSMTEMLPADNNREVALVDLLDRVLAGGVVISGDITLSIADVDLVVISLRTLVSSVGSLYGRTRSGDPRMTEPHRELQRSDTPAPRHRINSDPATVERGLASLVLTLVELLRQLMERQAIRRVDRGDLSDEQVEADRNHADAVGREDGRAARAFRT